MGEQFKTELEQYPLAVPDRVASSMLGVSRATLWRNPDNRFPKPIRLGGRTLWIVSELRAVIDRAATERDARGRAA